MVTPEISPFLSNFHQMFVSACRISYSYTQLQKITKTIKKMTYENFQIEVLLSSSPASFQYNIFVILSSQLLVVHEISINRTKRQSRTAEHVF